MSLNSCPEVIQFRSYRLARGSAQSMRDGRLDESTHTARIRVDGGYDYYDVQMEGDIKRAIQELKKEGYEFF